MKAEKFTCSDPGYEILSFIFVAESSGAIYERNCKGNELAPIKGITDKMKPGQRMWLEDITAKTQDGTIMTLPRRCFRVE